MTGTTDTINGVLTGTETYSYDKLNRVTSITQSGLNIEEKRLDYQYDAASQRGIVRRYSDLEGTQLIASTNYTYDANGRLTDLTHINNSGTNIAAYDYSYDADNRITEFASPEGVSIYNYDKTDQLTNADHNYQTNEEYTYDENGNRTNSGYSTGENNRLESDGVYNYEYDNEGNLVRQTHIASNEILEYQWDYRNRLVGVVVKDDTDNTIASYDYTYDINNSRIAKSIDSNGDGTTEEIERYILDGVEIALVFDGNSNETERYFHDVGIDEVIAVEQTADTVYWSLADQQGSIRVLLDESGNTANQISYDAFGNITSETDTSIEFRFTYTGRELDPETGNYYYRARYYNPATGRFINEDLIGFAGGDTNLYRYVNNSPTIYTDPYGESIWKNVRNFALDRTEDAIRPFERFTAGLAEIIVEHDLDRLDTRFNDSLVNLVNQSDLAYGVVKGADTFTNNLAGLVSQSDLAYDTLNVLDQGSAGLASFWTRGRSDIWRENLYGELATRNHNGWIYDAGKATGASISFGLGLLTGAGLANGITISTSLGLGKLLAVGYQATTTAQGAYDSTRNYLEGNATAWDLLSFTDIYGVGLGRLSKVKPLRNAVKGLGDITGSAANSIAGGVRNAAGGFGENLGRNLNTARSAIDSVIDSIGRGLNDIIGNTSGRQLNTPDGISIPDDQFNSVSKIVGGTGGSKKPSIIEDVIDQNFTDINEGIHELGNSRINSKEATDIAKDLKNFKNKGLGLNANNPLKLEGRSSNFGSINFLRQDIPTRNLDEKIFYEIGKSKSIIQEIQNPQDVRFPSDTISFGTNKLIPTKGTGSYKSISKRIDQITTDKNITDKDIMEGISAILRGRKIAPDLRAYKDELTELARLVGHIEPSRSDAAVVYGGMLNDLIKNGKMTFKEAFDSKSNLNGGIFPPSHSGAVGAMRRKAQDAGFPALDAKLLTSDPPTSGDARVREHVKRQKELIARHFEDALDQSKIDKNDLNAVEDFLNDKYGTILEKSVNRFYGVQTK